MTLKFSTGSPTESSNRCVTCGNNHADSYVLECDACYNGTPGSPKKIVRHCSICGKNIITYGVVGSVRLVCGPCAEKDLGLIESEKIARERDRLLNFMESMSRERAQLQANLSNLKKEFEQQSKDLIEENRKLQHEIDSSEDNALAIRLQAKMRMQYGENDKQKLLSFLEWARKMIVADASDEKIVEVYCRGGNLDSDAVQSRDSVSVNLQNPKRRTTR